MAAKKILVSVPLFRRKVSCRSIPVPTPSIPPSARTEKQDIFMIP